MDRSSGQKYYEKVTLGDFGLTGRYYLAREQVKAGTAMRTPQLADNLRTHFGLVGEEARQALMAVLDETPAEAYVPPRELKDPPGTPFVYDSQQLKCRLYVKVQVEGSEKKPRVLVWSCHPEWYGRKGE